MPEIESFDARAGLPIASVVAVLARDGAVILHDAVTTAVVEAVAKELRPHFDVDGKTTENDFNGYRTLRVGAVLGRSPATAALIAHPALLSILDAVLLAYCSNYRIGSTTGIEIHPGEMAQMLHRDDAIYPLRIPGVEWQVAANWALDDFNTENGGTRVVLQSHRWNAARHPTRNDAMVQAVMSRGSVLLYLGSVYHGGGANRTDRPRMGLVNTYSLGWLRQEENQYLSVDRAIADRLPPEVRRLMGYQRSGLLGSFPGDEEPFQYPKRQPIADSAS
jgi:predicted nucleic acid-binding protein